MIAYKFNAANGRYVGEVACQVDPLESQAQGKEVFLLPASCTFVKPPVVPSGSYAVWRDRAWVIETPEAPEPEPVPEPTPEDIKAMLTDSVQAWMDAAAQAKGYDSIFTAITYVDDDDPTFAAEGAAFKRWRSRVWRRCYDILDEVVEGKRGIPSAEDLIAELPALEA